MVKCKWFYKNVLIFDVFSPLSLFGGLFLPI